ncbi:hypothetical protein SAY87_015601 [Trapa incisa]|uniref:Acyl-CoA dehydrogenase/oxidase N-terminal domain-containing protein n=1 Tax=Trapa incisa TaxID=236973 RepID=A0AAN7QXB8_9MYRT|nr:hypothetical protein SAY87_015601 [Trapa incisa]
MQRLCSVGSLLNGILVNNKLQRAPFSTSLLFDDTQLQFKESVAQFAQENIAPHASKIDQTNSFPKVEA